MPCPDGKEERNPGNRKKYLMGVKQTLLFLSEESSGFAIRGRRIREG